MQKASSSRAAEDQYLWNAFQHHSRTFSLAAQLLPGSVQMPIATLYLFCRTVDNIADHRVLEIGAARALDELAELRLKLDDTLAGTPPEELLWQRLHEVHARFALHTPPLYELLEGASWDLSDRRVEDEQDLIAYAGLVGGSVGAMMLPFLVADRVDLPVLEAPARDLGIAMQITNITRDVGEDLRELGRVYLPRTWMADCGLAAENLHAPGNREAYGLLLEALMEAAEARYLTGLQHIGALPFRVRTGIRAAARMYREIMNEVRALSYDNINQRAFVSLHRKLRLVLQDDYERQKGRLSTPTPVVDRRIPTVGVRETTWTFGRLDA